MLSIHLNRLSMGFKMIAWLGIIALLLSRSLLAQEPMKLVYFHDYAPFSWEENGEMKGIIVDILNEALVSRMKIQVSHKGYPWARAQLNVKQGISDAFTTVPTDKRREYTHISEEAVLNSRFFMFIPATSLKMEELKSVKTIADLKHLSHIQYIGNGWAKQHLTNMNIKWTPSVESVLRILNRREYDVFADAEIPTLWSIKKLGLENNILKLPTLLDSKPFKLCIGKNSKYKNILSKFDETLIKIRQDGFLQKVYNQYR